MILTGREIAREVGSGAIIISPFHESNVNPNSYNYHLGTTYIEKGPDRVWDAAGGNQTAELRSLSEGGLVLQPGYLYLCNTEEVIGSTQYVTLLIGKSSMGRLGLFLQASADLGHQGEIHCWTLELTCAIPIRIYPRMVIGQVSFWRTKGSFRDNQGRYGRFNAPTSRREGLH